MLVKIGNNYYDSTKEPILLILGDIEKDHITNMGESKRYCSFPEESNINEIKEFMEVPKYLLECVDYKEDN